MYGGFGDSDDEYDEEYESEYSDEEDFNFSEDDDIDVDDFLSTDFNVYMEFVEKVCFESRFAYISNFGSVGLRAGQAALGSECRAKPSSGSLSLHTRLGESVTAELAGNDGNPRCDQCDVWSISWDHPRQQELQSQAPLAAREKGG